jgi:hypothetical protein
MSNLTPTALISAIGLLHIYVFASLDRVREERQDKIIAGMVEGVQVSHISRQIMLYASWMMPVGLVVGTQVVMDVVYLTMANSVSAEGLRTLAYVFVFWSSVGAFVYLIYAPLWLLHLRSLLRQAEAD